MKLSYTKMFAVWFTVGVALAFLLFASALIPGFNIGAVPTFIVFSSFVHLGMFFWIMWTYIMEEEDSDVNLTGGYDSTCEQVGEWNNY